MPRSPSPPADERVRLETWFRLLEHRQQESGDVRAPNHRCHAESRHFLRASRRFAPLISVTGRTANQSEPAAPVDVLHPRKVRIHRSDGAVAEEPPHGSRKQAVRCLPHPPRKLHPNERCQPCGPPRQDRSAVLAEMVRRFQRRKRIGRVDPLRTETRQHHLLPSIAAATSPADSTSPRITATTAAANWVAGRTEGGHGETSFSRESRRPGSAFCRTHRR